MHEVTTEMIEGVRVLRKSRRLLWRNGACQHQTTNDPRESLKHHERQRELRVGAGVKSKACATKGMRFVRVGVSVHNPTGSGEDEESLQ